LGEDAFPRLAQWQCRLIDGAYSCGGSRGLNRVPVLAPAWPKNLERPRLRSGRRVVNRCRGCGDAAASIFWFAQSAYHDQVQLDALRLDSYLHLAGPGTKS